MPPQSLRGEGCPTFMYAAKRKVIKKRITYEEKIPETAGVGMSRGRRQVNEEAEKLKH